MHFTVKSICKILYFVQSVSSYMVSKIKSYVICDNFSYLGILRMFGYMMGYIVVDICICRILQHKIHYSCVLQNHWHTLFRYSKQTKNDCLVVWKGWGVVVIFLFKFNFIFISNERDPSEKFFLLHLEPDIFFFFLNHIYNIFQVKYNELEHYFETKKYDCYLARGRLRLFCHMYPYSVLGICLHIYVHRNHHHKPRYSLHQRFPGHTLY